MTIRDARKKNSALSNSSWITWGRKKAGIQRLTLSITDLHFRFSPVGNFEDKASKPTASDRQHLSLLERVSRVQSIDSKTQSTEKPPPPKGKAM